MANQSGDLAIEARGLQKSFGPVAAVAGLDLQVNRGEIFGLVGPDGAGKTTTMRMLSGAMAPTGGSARICGFDVVVQAREAKRRVGYVPQRLSLYGELTVEEHIRFNARLRGITGRSFEERRDQLLSFSRLAPFRDRLAEDLSGGMRQKLALACGLLHQPEVLLLDEPTTGLDPVSRGEFWELLLELVGGGSTVLASTAYMEEAERCQRLGLLYRGRLLRVGLPDEIRRQAALELLEVACQPLFEARNAVRQASGVRWVELFGDRLHVAVHGAEQAEQPVREAAQRAGVRVETLRAVPVGLEDAFFELVREAEGVR